MVNYWNPDEFDTALSTDVEVPPGSGRYFKIRALDPEDVIEFSKAIKAMEGRPDDDEEKQRASFDQMRAAIQKATLEPKLTDEAMRKPGFGKILIPLFKDIMAYSGFGESAKKSDEEFRA